MFIVFVEGLDLYAYHGVPAEERVIGHRYQVDISLTVDGTADITDAVTDTVDYGQAAQLAERIVKENQYFTVERLANEIGTQLLTQFPLAASATITVRKPNPPAPIIAAAAGAMVTLTRG